jgi:hypothetical protein
MDVESSVQTKMHIQPFFQPRPRGDKSKAMIMKAIVHGDVVKAQFLALGNRQIRTDKQDW